MSICVLPPQHGQEIFATPKLCEKVWPPSSYKTDLIKLIRELGKCTILQCSSITDKHQICNWGVWFVQHKHKEPTCLFPQRMWALWDRLCFYAEGERARYTFPSTSRGKWRQSKNIHSKDGNTNPYKQLYAWRREAVPITSERACQEGLSVFNLSWLWKQNVSLLACFYCPSLLGTNSELL